REALQHRLRDLAEAGKAGGDAIARKGIANGIRLAIGAYNVMDGEGIIDFAVVDGAAGGIDDRLVVDGELRAEHRREVTVAERSRERGERGVVGAGAIFEAGVVDEEKRLIVAVVKMR